MRNESNLSFFQRWRVYQAERFPVLTFAPLLAAFSFCGVCLSRLVRHDYAWPSALSSLTAFVCVFLFFLQLRFLDEFKDAEVDAKYRPERPVPRGLVSLRQIGRVFAVTVAVQLALTLWLSPKLLVLLFMVWGYMALMTVEFFVPEWIKPRLLTYMWTHMLIMPLIDFFATGCDWLTAQTLPPAGLLLFLLVSFFNGLLIELGRKTWAPEQERPGVDSYSSYCGLPRALRLFRMIMAASYLGALGVGWQVNFFAPTLVVMTLLLLAGLRHISRFRAEPDAAGAKKLEKFSGLWVIVCYLMMGILPLGAAIWAR